METTEKYHFIKELHGHPHVMATTSQLRQAVDLLGDIMFIVKDVNPEYYDKIMRVRRDLVSLKIDLEHQCDGFIAYAKS